jgi:hypothetical protein
MSRIPVLRVLLCLCVAVASDAGQAAPSAGAGSAERAGTGDACVAPTSTEGPWPPVLPDTISRDESGRVMVRAVRLGAPLRLDGRLDEAVYREIRPASDFIQTDPLDGAPATEKTELWILFDEENVYVGARMGESQPERMIVTDMRRDGANVFQGSETFSFIFDTFYDRRNAVGFIINPIGGRADGQITNERWNRDWNTIWDFGIARFDREWTVEMAIPFKSLRYRPGPNQIWGFNARRSNRWKNEVSHLTAVSNAEPLNGLFKTSQAATLVGLEVPPGSKNLEIKPYAISNLSTDRAATRRVSNDLQGELGLDVKYGVTQNLTADFTYNTDFAQVEADEQQVNLTRFSLFFPEKREFFLENPGLFTFGGASGRFQGSPAGDVPLLFYSRRIGLNQGRVVPIDAGGRLTGRVGRYSLGLVNIHTGEEPVSRSRPTNFSLIRLKRDVLRRSSVGLIATGRSVSIDGTGSNAAYGVDGVFSFFENLDFNTYWARTRTDGLSGDDTSYRVNLDYGGDRYGVQLERLVVGDHFNPEVGFLRRDDMRKASALVRFSPRPRSIRSVRKWSRSGSVDYIENGAGLVETRETEGQFGIEFNNSDRFNASYTSLYELLPRPFRIAPGIVLPIGGYDADRVRLTFNFGQQRVMSSNLSFERGSFYTGHRTAVGFSNGRVTLGPQFSVEPTYSVNWVDLREGSFTTHLAGSRVTYTMTPRMFASALLQYNSTNRTMAANVRLRWEYAPGSELFVVYNDERDTLARGFPDLSNRAFIIKINRLLRF